MIWARRGFLAGSLALAAAPAQARPVMDIHDAPRPILSPPITDGSGRSLTLADFRGRLVLLNIWATWCPPCREEMPTLDALEARLGGPDFLVLPLSIDRAGMGVVRRFYRETGVAHLGVYLTEELRGMMAFGITALPTTLLLDRQGREIARRIGPENWNSRAAVAGFRRAIAHSGTGR